MFNGVLLSALAAIIGIATTFVARLGAAWLYALVAIGLVVSNIFGAIFVPVGPFTVNVGNVFYACVFFGMQLLVEHYGPVRARKTVWLAACGGLLLIVAVYVTLALDIAPGGAVARDAIHEIFATTTRASVASILAFVVAQYVHIMVYDRLKRGTRGVALWLRSSVGTVVGQGVDSVLYFGIALYGAVALPELAGLFLAGFLVKCAIGIVLIPLLYLTRYTHVL